VEKADTAAEEPVRALNRVVLPDFGKPINPIFIAFSSGIRPGVTGRGISRLRGFCPAAKPVGGRIEKLLKTPADIRKQI
jgi:hypothetical protein